MLKKQNTKKPNKTRRISKRSLNITYSPILSDGLDNAFELKHGESYLIGFQSGRDLPNEASKKTRGEIYSVKVDQKRKGIGTNLCINALKIMKEYGSTTVVMNAVSYEGKELIESLIRKGYISPPIKTSNTGKMEFIIMID